MKKDFIDHLTSVPALLTIAALICVVVYCFFIQPQNYYVINSKVLAKGSYIDMAGNDNIKYLLLPNFFGEIKKKSSYQKDIPMLELQKAAYRKELKVLKSLNEDPENTQAVFDTAIWYIASSGIKSNVNQVKKDRNARLIAGYYYLKKLEQLDPKSKETTIFIKKIDKYLSKKLQNDPVFIDSITHKPTKNLEAPPTIDEINHIALLEDVLDNPEDTTKLQDLCEYYDDHIKNSKPSQKLGFLLATKACYSNLLKHSPKNNDYKEKIKTLSKNLNSFNDTLK